MLHHLRNIQHQPTPPPIQPSQTLHPSTTPLHRHRAITTTTDRRSNNTQQPTLANLQTLHPSTTTPLHRHRALTTTTTDRRSNNQHSTPSNFLSTLNQAEQRQAQQDQEQGTLSSFLWDSDTDSHPNHHSHATKTSHIAHLRQQASLASEEAAKALGLRTRSEQQTTSMNVTFMAGRAAKLARQRVTKTSTNMNKIFAVRRNKILKRRRDEMALLRHNNQGGHSGPGGMGTIEHSMITSAGLHALQVKDKLYKKRMKISHAKHKLKGFTRALIASGSNLKYYFKHKMDAEAAEAADATDATDTTDAAAATAMHKSGAMDQENAVVLEKDGPDHEAGAPDEAIEFQRLQEQRHHTFLQLCTKHNILPEPIEITLEAPPCARPDMLPYRHPRQRRVLRISHRSLSNGMIVALAESLDNNAVDDIYASGNCMLESGLRSLVHSQTGTTRLTVLDISRNVLEKFLPPIAGVATGVETSVIGETRGTSGTSETSRGTSETSRGTSETSRGTSETSGTRATTSETRATTRGTGTNGRTLACHPRNAGTQALHDFFHATHATNVLSTDLARRLRGNRGGYPACPLIVVNLSSMKLGDVRGAYLGKAFTLQVLHPMQWTNSLFRILSVPCIL
jgi:hypothetical protein